MRERSAMTRRQFLGCIGSATAAAALCGLTGCSASSGGSATSGAASASLSGSVTAVGSTALQPLVEAAAEQFMNDHSSVQITIQGGGSGQGITQISQHAVQIGNSDVFAETKLSQPSDANSLIDNRVCVVGMGPVVNKSVSIDAISLDDLKKIFTGQVTNWKEVGGADEAITVINRASGSGTRATFEDAVLGSTKAPDSFKPQEQDSSGTVRKMISQTPGAISYLAFSYFDDSIKTLKVDNVAPESANVENNTWTIWAYEHMYTSNEPDETTQAFIDYMMSDDVQQSFVTQNGYIPVSGMKVSRDAQGTVSKLS
ncbi:MAG: phosphate ABC transporter substrate-binding protein PstS family protein [Eggerthellaceae bacterium]|jgi:phosphate transport system substrate-binding protein|nr:phosphate ABC transporter substrate-binding protein PstS family protein [Eggerthellaceae bacterium]MCH4221002.1 phosphate ABC transporter substrate-binding protein PstS family protein [Eggerthellaceae bacterium]